MLVTSLLCSYCGWDKTWLGYQAVHLHTHASDTGLLSVFHWLLQAHHWSASQFAAYQALLSGAHNQNLWIGANG